MDSPQNIISLCTGYGGIELGIKRVVPAIRTVCYVEIEAFAIANLVTKIEKGQMDTAPVWTNLKSFDGQPFRGKVHGIIGGYPCQPFSNAGKRRGKEDPRHLWPYIEEHIRTIRPLWCFFENVGGHLTLGFDEVYKSLRDLGYKVEAGLFTAAEIGAPHKRERLFIMAYSGEFRAGNIARKIDGRDRSKVLRQGNRQACTSGTNTASTNGRKILAHSESIGNLREPGTIQQTDGGPGRSLLWKPVESSERQLLAHTVNSTSRPDTGGNAETDRLPCQCGQEVCSGQLEGASKQLGNTRCIGQTQRQEQTARAVESSQELANAELLRRRRRDNGEPGRQGRSLQVERSGELANSQKFRIQGSGPTRNPIINKNGKEALSGGSCQRTQYPARPGQQQHDWEEPRTIKSRLGRTANGHSCRVDRLRLCGNGVNPDTAELAFETLIQQASENLKQWQT